MIRSSNYDYLFKIVLVGDAGVGKTSLVHRFCDEVFSGVYISTVGVDFRLKTLEKIGSNKKKVKLQIWDTAGQERFQALTSHFFRGASGVILVYDVSNASSFSNLRKWLRESQESAPGDCVKMLLGNKSDLSNNRAVMADRGAAVAEANGAVFMETSARTGVNVEKAFRNLAEYLVDKTEKRGDGAVQQQSGSNVFLSPAKDLKEESKGSNCLCN